MKKTAKPTAPNFEEDASVVSYSSEDLLKVLAKVDEAIRLASRIENGEALLADLREKHRAILDKDLPAMMETYGLKDLTTSEGFKVLIKNVTRASIPTESAIEKEKDPEARAEKRLRFERALAYLKKAGAEAIIKNEVSADLGKGSAKIVPLVKKALKELGLNAEVSKGVNANTLTAWVKERLEAGREVDFDLLGVYTGKVADIIDPRAKAKKK